MGAPVAQRDVAILGVGLHPFGRFPGKTFVDLGKTAIRGALDDAQVKWKDIQAAYVAHMHYQGASPGERILAELGLTGIPIVNVENACASGSTAFWQAYWGIATGIYDIVLAAGTELVPKGPVSTTTEDSPERLLGTDHAMASYAMRTRKYMEEYEAPIEGIAQVSVKAHKNASMNPYAQFQQVFSLEDVLNSRMICDPQRLYMCCPTSEGASAAILCAKDLAKKYSSRKPIYIAGCALGTSTYARGTGGEEGEGGLIPRIAKTSYAMAGMGPKDMDIVQVHDAGTIGEIGAIEELGLMPKGEGWRWTLEGKTAIEGELPVNTDGGLQAMGHPFGATGIRMLHELTLQLRGEAGPRQVKNAKVGIAQNAGAGGVCTVIILNR